MPKGGCVITSESLSSRFTISKGNKGKPTKFGVCLTPFEFDWLANILLRHKSEDSITLKSDKSPRTLSVTPTGKKTVGFYIEQQINDEIRYINLYKKFQKI